MWRAPSEFRERDPASLSRFVLKWLLDEPADHTPLDNPDYDEE